MDEWPSACFDACACTTRRTSQGADLCCSAVPCACTARVYRVRCGAEALLERTGRSWKEQHLAQCARRGSERGGEVGVSTGGTRKFPRPETRSPEVQGRTESLNIASVCSRAYEVTGHKRVLMRGIIIRSRARACGTSTCRCGSGCGCARFPNTQVSAALRYTLYSTVK